MVKKRHQNKHVIDAIKYAENKGWRYEVSSPHAHSKGKLYCPFKKPGGCIIYVWSTPKSLEIHAKQIVRAIDQCTHVGVNGEEKE